jgi:glucosyl-dolichyl phosphate glucuronosyltransferase
MLTVIMATRNRASVLNRVLECFTCLQTPSGGWKLVLVDNGSTDSTPFLLRAYSHRLPMHMLQQQRPGMNAALNAAVEKIEGDLVVKADDDVMPCAAWLTRYRDAADSHPERTLFGGAVEPEWPGPLPSWLTEKAANFGILYAQSRWPEGPCPLSRIYGPNWAVRSHVFAQGTRFDEQIGPDATRLLYPMGGETEFFSRLSVQGHLGYFVPGAAVGHIIRPEQLTERWILDRAYRNGLGVGLTNPPECAVSFRLGGISLSLLLRSIAYRSLGIVVYPLPRSAVRLRFLFQASWFRGLSHSVTEAASAIRPGLTNTIRPKVPLA